MRKKLVDIILKSLTNDLRKPEYRNNPNPVAGHCYVVSEFVYWLEYGKWKPYFIRHEGQPHWFLRNVKTGKVCDLTASQFKTPVPYRNGVGKGFLTNVPSKRCTELTKRVLSKWIMK